MAAHVRHLGKACKLKCLFRSYISCRCLHSSKKLHDSTTTTSSSNSSYLWKEYEKCKQSVAEKPLAFDISPKSVFANNELDLDDIDVYGFDYDYTLACYNSKLYYLIYDLGKQSLIQKYKYPKDIANLPDYKPDFAVRGLHCDVNKGMLLKLDAFHNIQAGTVYRGLQRVDDEEVNELYNGGHVNMDHMSSFYGTGNMHQLMDQFALPEMTLYATVLEFLIQQNIPYNPEYIFYEIRNAISELHSGGTLKNEIMKNLDVYLNQQEGKAVADFLSRLKTAGKKLFLITNSEVEFVDAGMQFLVGAEWTELFDVIITDARKPKFFYKKGQGSRPFRLFDKTTGTRSWEKVSSLKPGNFYQEGNLAALKELTDWEDPRVLYFGDNVYSDLADVALRHGWRTAAIIPELEEEIQILNSSSFKQSVRWLMALQKLIDEMQVYEDAGSEKVLEAWIRERDTIRTITKNIFNPRFGSVFRTYHNPTYFTRRMCRFADVYTSSVVNFANFSLKHTFYPRRAALPHEGDVI